MGQESTKCKPVRVRFFIDPALSDDEITERIVQMTEEHFDVSDDGPSDE